MKEIIIDGVTYTLTPKKEILVFGKYKIGSCVVSLKDYPKRKKGDVFKILGTLNKNNLWYLPNGVSDDENDWRQATKEETAEYEKRGSTYNISELKP